MQFSAYQGCQITISVLSNPMTAVAIVQYSYQSRLGVLSVFSDTVIKTFHIILLRWFEHVQRKDEED